MNVVWHGYGGNSRGLMPVPRVSHLCQNHPTDKVTLIKHGGSSCLPDELVNEPLKVPLEYTLTPNPVDLKNSVQAGFGGIRLPTAIKQSDETITNLGNLVAVKSNNCHAIFVSDGSIAAAEVATVGDGSVHQGFDLTHLVGLLGMNQL
jgi:hypothetical protein